MRVIAGLLIAVLCSLQMPIARAQTAANSAQVTVPQGTSIPLTLVSTIRRKTTKPGDAVRAQVAFPVTVGTQVAIPAGTYVEGIVTSVSQSKARGRGTQTSGPSTQLRFTRLLFANGYSAPLDAVNIDAMLIVPELAPPATDELADARDGAPYLGEGFGDGTGQTTPALPHEGPNPAIVFGAVAGAAAVTLVLTLTLGRRHGASADYVLFESGWQFQIALQTPLTLDAAKVSAAAAIPAK